VTELKNRSVLDVFIAYVNGLRGFLDAIEETIVQGCHWIRLQSAIYRQHRKR
jgi:transposase-like protein